MRIPYYEEQLSELRLKSKMNEKVGYLSGGQRRSAALVMSTITPVGFLSQMSMAVLNCKTAETIM